MAYVDEYNRDFKKIAQRLRKTMTPEEKKLWYQFLKYLPCTVNRQKTISDYIVDFYIAQENLVIELDGIQHGDPDNMVADQKRDEKLTSLGCKILRFSNTAVHQDFDTVCRVILDHLGYDREDLKTKARSF